MQSLTKDENQQTPPTLTPPSLNSANETLIEEEETEKPRKLVFEPEPTQRMVVVRRRRRRRSKKTNKTERIIGRVRIALLVVIFGAICLKLAGRSYLTSVAKHLQTLLHPIKGHLHFQVPDLEVIVLIVIALGLIYTIPSVQSRINRMLGLNAPRT